LVEEVLRNIVYEDFVKSYREGSKEALCLTSRRSKGWGLFRIMDPTHS